MAYTEESERLLRDCRELLTGRMRTSVTRMLGDVEEVLFDMATSQPATASCNPDYIEAVREIRMKRREIQLRFQNRLLEQFDRVVNELQACGQEPHGPQAGSSTAAAVIDIQSARPDPYLERVEKLREQCRGALVELDRHVGKLLQTMPDAPFENPLSPVTVFAAFRDSCRDIPLGPDVRHILLDRFDRHIGPVLQCVYQDLNQLFQSLESGTPRIAGRVDIEESFVPADKPVQESNRTSSLLVGSWIRERVIAQTEMTELPGFVREFLLGAWTQVLERIYEKHGENSPDWHRAMQVVIDLQDCIVWTADKEAKKQQSWMLPGLIYRLKAGMKTVAIPLKQQADFLSRLKALHTRITEAGTGFAQPG